MSGRDVQCFPALQKMFSLNSLRNHLLNYRQISGHLQNIALGVYLSKPEEKF